MQYSVHRFESVTSTNDLAARMAEEGAPEGTVVIADEQVHGRGRRGRQWVSPPGSGLYVSVVLRPHTPSSKFWQLAFVASLAVEEAIRRSARLNPMIKWPNDILVNGHKVSGILVEARKPRISFEPVAVIGIGINVNTPEFPPELAETATSMAIETGRPVSVHTVERELLNALHTRYEQYQKEGFRSILDAWRARDCTVGRDVVVQTPEGTVVGTAVEVNTYGDLVVRVRGGELKEITAGEVLLAD